MKAVAISLALISPFALGGAQQDFDLCMSKFEAAERHAELLKVEHVGRCHYFYIACGRGYWEGHVNPLIDIVSFILPTTAHNRAMAAAVKIGDQCMSLLDELE